MKCMKRKVQRALAKLTIANINPFCTEPDYIIYISSSVLILHSNPHEKTFHLSSVRYGCYAKRVLRKVVDLVFNLGMANFLINRVLHGLE